MLIELGNPAPQQALKNTTGEPCPCCGDARYLHAPLEDQRVTYVRMPGEAYPLEPGADVRDIALHIARNPDKTNLPGLEPLLSVVHPSGAWNQHVQGAGTPSWVRCSGPSQWDGYNEELERLISEYYGIPRGAPDDLEATHWTQYGSTAYAPGVSPDPLGGIVALKTNAGNDIQAIQMANAGSVLGQTGTATATSATSLTGGTEAPGGSHATDDCVGHVIVAWSNGAYGLITANTSGTSPVFTVDRWYVPGSPGGVAAATPSATTGYSVIGGSPPAFFMGLTATSGSPVAGDTTLAGEITTAGGGLIRKICPTGHTTGAASFTLTPVFTANGSDTLPVTVAKIGVSQSLLSTFKQLFQTLLNVTATLSASGDQLTVTETVST